MKPTGEVTRKDEPEARLPLVLYLAPWAFVVLSAMKLKTRLLVAEGGGFDLLAEVSGLGTRESLGLLPRLALYRDDVLLMVVVGAIAFLGLLRVVRPRLRPLVAWLVTTALFLVFYAQLKSWWEVGTFISGRLMMDGLFGSGRDLIGEYATSMTVLKLVVALLALAGTCVLLYGLERYGQRLQLARRLQWAPVMATALAMFVVAASWAARVPPTPFSRAAATAAVSAIVGRSELLQPAPDLQHVPPGQLIGRYAQLANAPVPNERSAYFGKARGYDVIFLLLESLPHTCYDLPQADSALPNMRALERAAFVPAAHYATYPYSRRAYSSIFSSWYPLNGIRGAIERFAGHSRQLRAPGVVHSAAVEGYETAAFVPERPVGLEEDELRYDALGFEHHEIPPAAWDKPEGFQLDNRHRDWVRLRDRQSFDELKARVREAIDARRHYLYSFNPQVSHGPWPGITAESSREETCLAGLRLFGEVDTMLGELMALLREKGRLGRTLIVTLGDHGLRTRREYPPFHAGTLDDVTFHVPLVLYAPGVVDSSVTIPWMTSHIDIAPSVLDLLGIETDRQFELGSPMWNPRLASRATYFFAKGYLGADGFQQANQAIMVRYMFGGISRSPWNGTLRFAAADLLHEPDESALRTVRDLNTMAAIQAQLARTMLPSVTTLARPRPRPLPASVRVAAKNGTVLPPSAARVPR